MAKSKKRRLTARTSDRYVLYTESVQSPDSEIAFFRRVYRKDNGRSPERLREDFCGTAAVCALWVTRSPRNVALGVDLDPEPLSWGRAHYIDPLNEKQKARIQLVQDNVLTCSGPAPDVILALNFSYCVFKERSVLMTYLRRCRKALAPGGILVMDLYGGPEAMKPQEEKRKQDGFTYIWDQDRYNPITNEVVNHIHFTFPDGSRTRKAFTYDWRLWTLRELSEAMREAGFRDTTVYWEGADEDGEGDGIFRPRRKVDPEDAWVAYLVGHTKRRET